MDLINPGDLETGRPGFAYFLYVLRVFALVFGYLLAGTGWLLFFMCLLIAGKGEDDATAYFYRAIGIPIVSGWLLLRFSGGLFPFSRRFFQWQNRRG
jgi:hypothetical protein